MAAKSVQKRRSAWRALLDQMYRPVDAASLVVVRIAFGLLMVGLVLRFFAAGTIERLYLAQTLHFKYPFLSWLPDPSPWVLDATFVLVGITALMIAAGFLYRFASVVFTLSWPYIFFFDQTAYQNHDYLICLLGFLFTLMPLNRMLSIDAWLRPGLRAQTVPAWCLYIVRFQIAIVYVFGGIRKINPDWLRGEPIRTMLQTEAFEHSIIGEWFFSEPLVMAFAYGGLILDLLLVPALLWRVTRVPAFVIAVAFHLTNAWLWDIDMFPWFMIVATLAFFSPDYPRLILGKIREQWGNAKQVTPAERAISYSPVRQVTAAIVIVYAVFQVLIPCRPFLYPGHPLEQQDLLVFSWNMMLRLKASELVFIVVDHETGEKREVAPQTILSDYQCRARLGSPDMMHQAAQYLAEQERIAGRSNVSVYMHGRQSVHARPWQLAYDPEVDFAALPRTLGAKPWVMPFVEPYPPDPSARTAFVLAKWRFCKREGYLPFEKRGSDPEAVERVRAWETAYRKELKGE